MQLQYSGKLEGVYDFSGKPVPWKTGTSFTVSEKITYIVGPWEMVLK